jgi:hypothetical protein
MRQCCCFVNPEVFAERHTYHISQGDNVVYIVAPLYADAGRRPEFSNAAVSPSSGIRNVPKMYRFPLYMMNCRSFLHPHIVTSPQNFAISRYQSRPNLTKYELPVCTKTQGWGNYRNTTFFITCFCLFDGNRKCFLVIHDDNVAEEKWALFCERL